MDFDNAFWFLDLNLFLSRNHSGWMSELKSRKPFLPYTRQIQNSYNTHLACTLRCVCVRAYKRLCSCACVSTGLQCSFARCRHFPCPSTAFRHNTTAEAAKIAMQAIMHCSMLQHRPLTRQFVCFCECLAEARVFSFHMEAAIRGALMELALQMAVREVCPCG